MMEGFRHLFIDKTILNLIARRILVSEKHSKCIENGIYLNKRGREIVSSRIKRVYYHKFRKLIYAEIKKLIALIC